MAVPWQAIGTLAVLAMTFTGLPAYHLWREGRLRRHGVRAQALVVGIQERQSNSGGLTRSPVVEFRTQEGQTIRATSPASSSHPTVPPGRALVIYYDPRQPDNVAMVGHGLGTYRVLLAVGILLFVVLGALLFGSAEQLSAAAPIFVPVLLGGTFLTIGGFGVGRVWLIRATGGSADAVVTGEATTRTREGMPLHHPAVSFQLPNRQRIETTSERGRTVRRVHQGQRAPVRYHPDDPYRVVLAGDSARPLFSLFGIIGLLVLAGTAYVSLLLVR